VAVLVGVGLMGILVCYDAQEQSPRRPSVNVAPSAGVGADASCLGRDGRTQVGPGISDQDVSEISSSVGARDSRPIMSIERMPAVSNRRNRHGGEIKATTGVECHGHLSGHGSFFQLKNSDGRWSIAGEGWWVS